MKKHGRFMTITLRRITEKKWRSRRELGSSSRELDWRSRKRRKRRIREGISCCTKII